MVAWGKRKREEKWKGREWMGGKCKKGREWKEKKRKREKLSE